MSIIRKTTDDYKLKKIDLQIFISIMRSYYPIVDSMRELPMGNSTNRRRIKNYINSEIETAKTFDGTWISIDENKTCETCKYSYPILNEGLTGCNVRSGRLLPSDRVCSLWFKK
jgi:hypothetical protein